MVIEVSVSKSIFECSRFIFNFFSSFFFFFEKGDFALAAPPKKEENGFCIKNKKWNSPVAASKSQNVFT